MTTPGERLPLIRPDITFAEVEADLRAILDSGQLTSGPYVQRFEAALAEAVGVRHAVSTTSATTALHLGLVALGIGPGDEVLVSDFTFPASGNVVAQVGAVPVLVDCRPGAFDLDVDHAASLVTERTRAVLAVDPFGQPADLPALVELCRARGLHLVEDAACALGASRSGTACGAWPDLGCFSFHPRKVVTTGEGGAVTTDDDDLADRLRLLRNHGGRRGPAVGLEFVDNGFNYRLGEIPAALGLAQMARLDAILADRARTAACYDERLHRVKGVTVPATPPGSVWSNQSYVVLLDDEVDRDAVVAAMASHGIETTLGTYALHAQPAFARYGYAPGDLRESWAAQQRSLTLPIVPSMPLDEVDRVVDALAVAIDGSLRPSTTPGAPRG